MVSRVELLAAQSEARANKDEVQAKLGELARMQSQLNDARYEAAQLKAAMSGMVTREEVEQEKQRWQEVEAALKDDLQSARQASLSLNEKIGVLEGEKSKLVAKIQVQPCTNVRGCVDPAACNLFRAGAGHGPANRAARSQVLQRCSHLVSASDWVLSWSRAAAAETTPHSSSCSSRT
jgi:hypothetical protein